MVSKELARIAVVLPRSYRGKPSLRRLLLGLWQQPTVAVSRQSATKYAEARYIWAYRKIKERTQHGPSSAGPESSESKGHPMDTNDEGRLRELQRARRLRGPNRLGKLITTGPLGRAFAWRL
jgi:hypothetical protein